MTPQQATKVERAVEAIEALTLAVVTAKTETNSQFANRNHQDVLDTREECRVAFAEFVAPVLRAVQ